jgi:hypothetical protein
MKNAELGPFLDADSSSKDSKAPAGRSKSAHTVYCNVKRKILHPAGSSGRASRSRPMTRRRTGNGAVVEKNRKRRSRARLKRDGKGQVVGPAAHVELCTEVELQAKASPCFSTAHASGPEPQPAIEKHTPTVPPANARPDDALLRWLPTTASLSAESLASAKGAMPVSCGPLSATDQRCALRGSPWASGQRQGRGHPLL